MKIRNRKRRLYQIFLQNLPYRRSLQEEREWMNFASIGREFGSPDFERLMKRDEANGWRVSEDNA